jgi:hypothetical protein
MGLLDRFKKKTDDAAEEVKEPAVAAPVATAVPGEAAEIATEAAEAATDASDASSETTEVTPVAAGDYRKVHINPGKRGWGTGFDVEPKPGKDLVYSVTGGGIHPVAQRIADLSGGKPFDGFKSKADFDEIAVAVIDCGGTARIGVYPMKGVLTVDIHGASPSGPLVRFITEENFVSGVTPDDVEVVEG